MENKPVVSSYKGKPMLILNPADRWPFQFQIAKAKLIVDNFDAIKAFVDRYYVADAAPQQENPVTD